MGVAVTVVAALHGVFLAACGLASLVLALANPVFVVFLALAGVGGALILQAGLAGLEVARGRIADPAALRATARKLFIAAAAIQACAMAAGFATRTGPFVPILVAWGTAPAALDACLLWLCARWVHALAQDGV